MSAAIVKLSFVLSALKIISLILSAEIQGNALSVNRNTRPKN